jgi:hypothetical protein
MDQTVADLWAFLPRGYLLTIAIEIPVLLVGLSNTHSFGRRLVAGCWLTACTYPVVVLVLPLTVRMQWGETAYMAIAETFAPVAECLLFRAAYPIPPIRADALRDMISVASANVASFLIGLWIFA